MTTRTAGLPRRWVSNAIAESPLVTALLIACLIHLFLILGLRLVSPKVNSDLQTLPPLEVMVLQWGPSNEQPEVTDTSTQADRVVGDAKQILAGDEEPSVELVPEIPGFDPKSVLRESPSTPVLPTLSGPTGLGPVAAESRSLPELPQLLEAPSRESEPPRVDAAEILASRNLEIDELTAKIRHDSTAHRRRRKAISAHTREYKYANYLEAWRRKVERMGNLNYPQEAKRRKMYGNLTLLVAIRADGSIEQVRVLHSSGFDLLDEAAIKIVELAAPFSPFPPDIRAETDVLDITRTWRFLSNNRLGWER